MIFLVAVVLTTLWSAIYANAGRDVSWIATVEEYIVKENWLPNVEYEPIAFESFFLYENGEEHFFRLESHNEFISYVEGLLISVDRKLDYTISRDQLVEIKAEDELVCFILRFPTSSYGFLGVIDRAYFVLDYILGEDLKGTVLVWCYDSSRLDWWFNVWEITDLSIWYKFLSLQYPIP
jgi:hypothetical protein